MAPAAPRRLDPDELEAVLARAQAERWTELALLGPHPLAAEEAHRLIRKGWSAGRVFLLRERLDSVPRALARLTGLISLYLGANQIGDAGAESLARLGGLTTLDLEGNQIGDAGADALARLSGLTSLDLQSNQIGDAGAEALGRLTGLTMLGLSDNQIGDAGADALARLSGLTSLALGSNQIGDAGADSLARLGGLTELHLWANNIGYAGAESLARLGGLTRLFLSRNRIGNAGGRAILDSWADPATAGRRQILDLRENPELEGLLPAEVLRQTDAQVIIAAWRERRAEEAGRVPLPEPEAVGEPAGFGVQVGTGADGRLTLVDPPLASGAPDDSLGRELHEEVILALDRLIAAAGRSNRLVEWREAAEAVKERLGAGPPEVRVSAVLRIERLRGLREADERRRAEPDPLVEPAEAGVAAALRDAVAAANLYIETDAFLAEQQRRLADPGLDLALTIEQAAAVEADLEALDVAEPALLDELRQGRETAAAGGAAGERARVWLAGSWRNVLRKAWRPVLGALRAQAKAVRASADEAAMQAKLGTVITVAEAAAVLDAMGFQAKLAAAAAGGQALASVGRIWLAAEPEIGKGLAQAVKWGTVLLVARHLDLLPRLGWSPDFVAALGRLLGQTM